VLRLKPITKAAFHDSEKQLSILLKIRFLIYRKRLSIDELSRLRQRIGLLCSFGHLFGGLRVWRLNEIDKPGWRAFD
jgi:hypothetical protein